MSVYTPEPADQSAPAIAWACDKCREVVSAVGTVIVGKDEQLELILTTLVSNGHLLLEDVPGVAKTLAAQATAQALGLDFRRIQFVPDLLPGDIMGSFIYDSRADSFRFRRGPIFTNLILADEINRGTPKTQSALLEAMQEQQVTVEGQSFALDKPFMVIATQNPLEFEGTYPLPEAQIDRFLARLSMGYPSPEAECEMLARRQSRQADAVILSPVLSKQDFLEIQRAIETVHVNPDIHNYIVQIVTKTRVDRRVQLGASPRGSLALFKLSRSRAMMQGRDFVTPDDVKAVAVPALAHRVLLRPELWAERISGETVVRDALDDVPVPKAEWR
ncbi:MAG TPA: MoxR family ATPase [Bacillota bacterium]|jgi:MoxR-like ATPase|nr:MoxR family ATPase [Bacillota bacterium]